MTVWGCERPAGGVIGIDDDFARGSQTIFTRIRRNKGPAIRRKFELLADRVHDDDALFPVSANHAAMKLKQL